MKKIFFIILFITFYSCKEKTLINLFASKELIEQNADYNILINQKSASHLLYQIIYKSELLEINPIALKSEAERTKILSDKNSNTGKFWKSSNFKEKGLNVLSQDKY